MMQLEVYVIGEGLELQPTALLTMYDDNGTSKRVRKEHGAGGSWHESITSRRKSRYLLSSECDGTTTMIVHVILTEVFIARQDNAFFQLLVMFFTPFDSM